VELSPAPRIRVAGAPPVQVGDLHRRGGLGYRLPSWSGGWSCVRR